MNSSIVTRLTVIVVLALTMTVVASLAVSYVTAWRSHDDNSFVPLPGQVSAIVRLLEEVPADQRKDVLRAVSGGSLRAELLNEKPDLPKYGEGMDPAPGLDFIFRRFNETLRGRYLAASMSNTDFLRNHFGYPFAWALARNKVLHLVIGLNDGHYLSIETQSELGQRIFGIPPGFILTLVSSAIALGAIFALLREARPVKQLATALARFSSTLEPQMLPQSRAKEVRSLIEAFGLMQRRIIALIEGRTFIIGAVSHDLKTYVTRLRLRVESIDDEDKRDRAIGDLEEMSALIDDAQDFTKHSLVSPSRQKIDLAAIICDEINHHKDVPIAFESTATEACVLNADGVAVKRLVANLIGNAVKFAKHIRVSLIRGDKTIQFIVDDDGPGIPVDERASIFEPFYRVEKSRNRKTGGAGLGLAIADEIVRAHRGTIKAETSPMGGTRMQVELPC